MASLGVAFVSFTEALDLSTPSGRALAGMLAVFAEFERDLIRERVRGGLEARDAMERASDDRPRRRGTPRKREPSDLAICRTLRSCVASASASRPCGGSSPRQSRCAEGA